MAYPTLNANEIFGSLYNQIISVEPYAVGITYDAAQDIVTSRKVDGTLFGDTKVYVDTDVLRSYPWNDPNYNLLTKKRPPAPASDTISIDTFRQIPVTIDNYLTKRAWMDEGNFQEFNSIILGWMNNTRRVYEHTKFTAEILINAVASAESIGTIDLKAETLGTAAAATPLELNMFQKTRYLTFARKLKGILKELNEASRDYNDHGFLKNVARGEYDLILPIGIKDGFDAYDVSLDFIDVKEVHWKYFGTLLTVGGTSDGTQRLYVEKTFNIDNEDVTLFPGDLIPSGETYLANEAYTPTFTAAPDLNGETNLTFVLINKRDYPIPSAFSVNTSFFNAKDLDINHYLTFGYSSPANNHLGGKPLLKVSTVQA